MKEGLDKLHTRFVVFFWINLLILITAFLSLLYFKGSNLSTGNPGSITFERYAIILTLAAIPLSLKYFHSQYKKIQASSREVFLKKYKQASILRIVILDIVIIINMVGFYVFEAKNFIYMIIITLFALLFCYPNKSLLNPKTEIEENIKNE